MSLGVCYSAYHSPPFRLPKIHATTHQNAFISFQHPQIVEAIKQSKISINKSQQLKNPQSHHLSHLNLGWLRISVKIHPETYSLPSVIIYNSGNKLYVPKVKF